MKKIIQSFIAIFIITQLLSFPQPEHNSQLPSQNNEYWNTIQQDELNIQQHEENLHYNEEEFENENFETHIPDPPPGDVSVTPNLFIVLALIMIVIFSSLFFTRTRKHNNISIR